MAGFLAGNDSSIMEYECERYVIPVFRGAEFLVRVEGDSMTPSYMSGDIVACRTVPLDRLWFQWGKTYVIHTVQGILIKRMEPSEKDGFVRIESDNPKYKPFDLPVSEINGVALVMGMLRVG
jgi:phage repressor protein C with HTH and peptisase S24 domain